MFTFVRIMLSLFRSLWRNHYECKCSIASTVSVQCSPQNTVKGTWIYSAGHSTKYKKNNIVKMVKIKHKEAHVRFFFVTFTPNRWGIDGWEHSVYKLHFCYLVKRKK